VFPAAQGSSYGDHLIEPPTSWWGSIITGSQDGSGYQYRRNRYYDAKTGRFTQEDPIGPAGGLNAYGFANGDPITFSDPFGLCPLGIPCPDWLNSDGTITGWGLAATVGSLVLGAANMTDGRQCMPAELQSHVHLSLDFQMSVFHAEVPLGEKNAPILHSSISGAIGTAHVALKVTVSNHQQESGKASMGLEEGEGVVAGVSKSTVGDYSALAGIGINLIPKMEGLSEAFKNALALFGSIDVSLPDPH
jgi:RHS repeat-associated protein